MRHFLMTLGILFFSVAVLQAQTDSLSRLTQYMKQELELTEEQVPMVEAINVKYENKRKSIMQLSQKLEKLKKLSAITNVY